MIKCITEYLNKKRLLEEYVRDIEQVDLLGIDRKDKAEKIKKCKDLINELKEFKAKHKGE